MDAYVMSRKLNSKAVVPSVNAGILFIFWTVTSMRLFNLENRPSGCVPKCNNYIYTVSLLWYIR